MNPSTQDVLDKIAALERTVSALTTRVQKLEAAALPDGWTPSNLTLITNPAVTMCRHSDTGEWSVWKYSPHVPGAQFPVPLMVGKSIEEAARVYAAKAKP